MTLMITRGLGIPPATYRRVDLDIEIDVRGIIDVELEISNQTGIFEMASKIIMKQGEGKTIRFTIKENGEAVSVDEYTFRFAVKRSKKDKDYLFVKEDEIFNKAQAEEGIILCSLNAQDTSQEPDIYIGELKVTFPDATVDKSKDFLVEIIRAVQHD